MWRFCRKGTKARNGERVYLRYECWGGVIYTSRQWLDEFAERLATAGIEHFEATGPDAAGDHRHEDGSTGPA